MDVVGLFQEPLEAMFALINEMEMAVKINTSIIFGNSPPHVGEVQPLKSEVVSQEKKEKKEEEEEEEEVEHERVLRALPFVVGCVKRPFLVYF